MRKYVRSCGRCLYYRHDPNTDKPNPLLLRTPNRRWPGGIRRGGTCEYPEKIDPHASGPVDADDMCDRFEVES